MNKQKVTTATAAFTMFAALLMAVVSMVPVASAVSASATDISGFDKISASGCTNDDTYYHSANYGIRLYGGWGEFNLPDFIGGDIDFRVNFIYNEHALYITIKEDSMNYVEIKVNADDGSSNTTVRVKDVYDGEAPNSDSEKMAVDTYNNGNSAWTKVGITIAKTESSTDATKKVISVSVGGTEFFENLELHSGEASSEIKERKWNDITFESKSSEYAWVDDIDIDTDPPTLPLDLNYTILIVLFLLVGTAFVWYFKVWPLNGKVGFLKPVSRKVR